MKLADKGLTLPPQYFASVMGYGVQDFARALEEAHYNGMTDNLTMLMNVNTMKDGANQSSDVGGRPKKDTLERTDSTEQNQDYMN